MNNSARDDLQRLLRNHGLRDILGVIGETVVDDVAHMTTVNNEMSRQLGEARLKVARLELENGKLTAQLTSTAERLERIVAPAREQLFDPHAPEASLVRHSGGMLEVTSPGRAEFRTGDTLVVDRDRFRVVKTENFDNGMSMAQIEPVACPDDDCALPEGHAGPHSNGLVVVPRGCTLVPVEP